MKKLLIALVFAFCFGALSVSAATHYIKTEADFYNIKNDLSGTYYLENDIEIHGGISSPIGTEASPFKGIFDGQGHKITMDMHGEFKGYNTAELFVGLFGVSYGTIKNLGVDGNIALDFQEIPGIYCVAGLVAGNAGTIDNCYSDVEIDFKLLSNSGTGNSKKGTTIIAVAGLTIDNGGVTLNSYSSGNIKVDVNTKYDNRVIACGFIAYVMQVHEPVNCYSTSNVTAFAKSEMAESKLRAYNFHNFSSSGLFDGCYATGNVSYNAELPEKEHKYVSVFVDGNKLDFDVPPTIIDGRTVVPLRKIFEALGAQVEWDDTTKTVTGTKDGTTIKMTVGKNTFTVNGEEKTLDVAPCIIDGRTLVPARAVSESFGVNVEWHDDIKTVCIKNSDFTSGMTSIYDGEEKIKEFESFLVDMYC